MAALRLALHREGKPRLALLLSQLLLLPLLLWAGCLASRRCHRRCRLLLHQPPLCWLLALLQLCCLLRSALQAQQACQRSCWQRSRPCFSRLA